METKKKKYVLSLKKRLQNRKYFKEYYLKNKDRVLKKNRKYNKSKKAKEQKKEYSKTTRAKKIRKKWIEKNRDKVRAKNRKSYHKNREKNLNYSREYYKKIKSDPIKYNKFRARINFYNQQKRKNNPHYRIKQNLSRRLRTILNEIKNPKNTKILDILGCTLAELKIHLKKQFKKGMTWKNYGKWHVDHKIPCYKFDLRKLSDQKICFNYNNLQPLWAKENLIKSNK